MKDWEKGRSGERRTTHDARRMEEFDKVEEIEEVEDPPLRNSADFHLRLSARKKALHKVEGTGFLPPCFAGRSGAKEVALVVAKDSQRGWGFITLCVAVNNIHCFLPRLSCPSVNH